MNKEQIIEAIAAMSVLELSELVKELEEKFGVSAAAPVAVAAAPAAGGAAAEAAEEKTEFDVILKEVGGEKIKVCLLYTSGSWRVRSRGYRGHRHP